MRVWNNNFTADSSSPPEWVDTIGGECQSIHKEQERDAAARLQKGGEGMISRDTTIVQMFF